MFDHCQPIPKLKRQSVANPSLPAAHGKSQIQITRKTRASERALATIQKRAMASTCTLHNSLCGGALWLPLHVT